LAAVKSSEYSGLILKKSIDNGRGDDNHYYKHMLINRRFPVSVFYNLPFRGKQEYPMATIAVSCTGQNLDSPVDTRFGRAEGFLIVNTETMESKYIENSTAQSRGQGAGILSAETVARNGATAVLTGFVGPKAFQALQAAGIDVVQNMDNLSVREAVERYVRGETKIAEAANGGPGKGMGGGRLACRGVERAADRGGPRCGGTEPAPVSETGNRGPKRDVDDDPGGG
jgi:predicted Fe-Mo cluster-binding NifX family protein